MIRRVRRVTFAAVAGATAVLALAVTAMPGGAAATPCSVAGHAVAGVPHSRVLATSGSLVVYRVRGPRAERWWACRLRERVLIGYDDSFQSRDSEYGPSTTLGRLHFGIGGWLFLVAETGQDSYETSTKYVQYPCTGPTETLLAVFVGAPPARPVALTRFETDTTDAAGDGTDLRLARILSAAGGAVAWLERSQAFTASSSSPPVYALYGCVAAATGTPTCAPHEYAHGDIEPASVMLDTTTLSWRQDGRLGAAVLH